MTDPTHQLHEDILRIKDVLAIRETAITVAIETINAGLYHIAVNGDDTGILEYFEGKLVEAASEAEELKSALNDIGTFDDHMLNMANVARHAQYMDSLEAVRDLAKANVEFLAKGEAGNSPASKSTEELLTQLAPLMAQLKETEEAEENEQS